MDRYFVMFDNGTISMVVAFDITLDQANEIVGNQLDPSSYKVFPMDDAAEGSCSL